MEPIVRQFLELGYQVEIYNFRRSLAEIRNTDNNLRIVDLPKHEKLGKIYKQSRNLFQNLRSNIDQDASNIYFARSEVSSIGISILIALIFLGVRNSCVIFTQYPIYRPRFHHILWAFLIKRFFRMRYFTQVLTSFDSFDNQFARISDYGANLRKILQQNSEYIPLPIPKIEFDTTVKNSNFIYKQESRSFVTVAKCEPRKGLDLLIDKFQSISNQLDCNWRLKIHLQVLNENHKKFLKHLMNTYDLPNSNQIEIYINCTTEETRLSIRNSDVFILNSRNEPASFSHLEALSLCIPIIINRSNGSSSILPNQFGVTKIEASSELMASMITYAMNVTSLKSEISQLNMEIGKIINANALAKRWLTIAI